MQHIIYFIGLASATLIWTNGEIFEPFKGYVLKKAGKWDEKIAFLMYCSMCSGFWIGLAGAFVLDVSWLKFGIWNIPLSATITSLVSVLLDKIIFEKKI